MASVLVSVAVAVSDKRHLVVIVEVGVRYSNVVGSVSDIAKAVIITVHIQ